MKFTKQKINSIVLEELSSMAEEQDLEERNFRKKALAALGALGMMGSAQASPSRVGSLSDLGVQKQSASVASVDPNTFAGVLKDAASGERYYFNKDKEKNVTIFTMDGKPVRRLDQEDYGKFQLMPGWQKKVPAQFLARNTELEESSVKFTKSYLKQIIAEELQNLSDEKDAS